MPRIKTKKTFLKIKEKLVFVETQQKKIFTKKFFGVTLLIVGLVLLAFTFTSYFIAFSGENSSWQQKSADSRPWSFIIPKFFKGGINLKLVQKSEFIPERVIFPSLGVDFLIKNRFIEEKFKVGVSDFKAGDEILVFGKETYRSYLLSKVEDKASSESGMLEIDDNKLKLTLTLKENTPKVMIITGGRKP